MASNYKEFYGKNVDQMPKLLAEGLVPMSTAEIMKRQMNNDDFFVNRCIDTSDLTALDFAGTSDKIKFILTVNNKNEITPQGREALDWINYDSKIAPGYAIDLEGRYDSLEGIEVSVKKLYLPISKHLTQFETAYHNTWRILARHPSEVPKEFAEDEKLLEEYFKWVQINTKAERMPVHLDMKLKRYQKLRTWTIDIQEGRGPSVYNWGFIDWNFHRLIGLETQKTLEKVLD